jgi:hypothetical protein
LSRPGTKADLQAIEWIIAQAPNPNSRPIQWWISRLEEEDAAALDRDLIGFWIMASLLTQNSSLMWETSQIESLTAIEWTFTLPIGKFSRAILVDNRLAHIPSPGAWLVKGFWLQVLEMAEPKTKWRWSRRHPHGKGGSAREVTLSDPIGKGGPYKSHIMRDPEHDESVLCGFEPPPWMSLWPTPTAIDLSVVKADQAQLRRRNQQVCERCIRIALRQAAR